MQDIIDHLIKVHKCSHIAFICGPKDYPDAQQKFQAYQTVLAKNHLSYDPNLVVECKLFPENEGEIAIRTLVDKRNVEFDAIIAGNDYLAIGAMKTLKEYNFKIPEDIVVIGFDDIEEAKANSLTTVRQQLHIQGKRAVETLLDLIEGKNVPEVVISPTELVKRESCGCNESEIDETPVQGDAQKVKTIEQIFNAERKKVLSEIIKTMENPRSTNSAKQIVRLLNAFYTDLTGESNGLFLTRFDEIFNQALSDINNNEIDAITWQKAISIIRREVLLCDCDHETLKKIEPIWHQARVKIAKAAQQLELCRRLQIERQAINLREIGEKLITTVEMHELMDILAQELVTLGIPSCYIFLYVREFLEHCLLNPNELPEFSRLMLSYDNSNHKIYGKPGQFFKTNQLIADFIANRKGLYSIVIEPLNVRDEQLGFIIFEMGPKKGIIYESLCEEISSSLKGALLVQEVQKGSEQLKRAQDTARLVAEVIVQEDLDETLQAIAQGTKNVLHCDAVTLYPYDLTTNKILSPVTVGVWDQRKVLGRRGVEEGSFVYQVFHMPKPYIVEQTAKDILFKDRRFTKEEKIESCVGIPLETADQKVGVMFVNFRLRHRFTDEELEDIMFYANQAAAAIRNAQLREIAKRGKTYLEALYEAGQTVNSSLALEEIFQLIVDQAQKITGYYREPPRFSEIAIIETNNKLQIKAISPRELFPQLMTLTSPYFTEWTNKEKRGIIGRVAETGISQLVNNVELDPDYKRCDPGTRSELAVPIKIGKHVIGVINIEHSQYGAFTDEDLQYLESLAAQAAIAIKNARDFEELKLLDQKKTEFLSTVSHELRTPLTSVQSFIENMRDGIYGSINDKQDAKLKVALNSTRLEAQLIENLLDMLRIQENKVALQLERGDVTKIIKNVINIFEYEANRKKISIIKVPPDDKPIEIMMDSNKITQVFMNLVGNALKFTANNGQITIATYPSKHQLMVQVKDTGIGIPKEECEKIFDRFYQVDGSLTRKVGGAGIGLSIVKKYIEMHNGRIQVESKIGEGSVFSFTLPNQRG